MVFEVYFLSLVDLPAPSEAWENITVYHKFMLLYISWVCCWASFEGCATPQNQRKKVLKGSWSMVMHNKWHLYEKQSSVNVTGVVKWRGCIGQGMWLLWGETRNA